MTLKRIDYKDTIISEKTDYSFYLSPYFYIPMILTLSLIGIGDYYYYNRLDYMDLSQIDIDNILSESGSPDEYSDYLFF